MTIREYLQTLTLKDFFEFFKDDEVLAIEDFHKMFYKTVAKYATVYPSNPLKDTIVYLKMRQCRAAGWIPQVHLVKLCSLIPNFELVTDALVMKNLKTLEYDQLEAIEFHTLSEVLDLEVFVCSNKLRNEGVKHIACLLFDTITFNGFTDKAIAKNTKKIFKSK